MKRKPNPFRFYDNPWDPKPVTIIQAPLPGFLDVPPRVQRIPGRGSGRQGPSPSAPRAKGLSDEG